MKPEDVDRGGGKSVAVMVKLCERSAGRSFRRHRTRARSMMPVFWELIGRSRADAPGTTEQVAVLGALLKAFKATEIKRFGAIYAGLMKHLYHWNVWALAYAARDGCSDGAFKEFRNWLILQGDPALLELDDCRSCRGGEARTPRSASSPTERCCRSSTKLNWRGQGRRRSCVADRSRQATGQGMARGCIRRGLSRPGAPLCGLRTSISPRTRCRRASSPRPGPAGRTSTRSRPRSSCASTCSSSA